MKGSHIYEWQKPNTCGRFRQVCWSVSPFDLEAQARLLGREHLTHLAGSGRQACFVYCCSWRTRLLSYTQRLSCICSSFGKAMLRLRIIPSPNSISRSGLGTSNLWKDIAIPCSLSLSKLCVSDIRVQLNASLIFKIVQPKLYKQWNIARQHQSSQPSSRLENKTAGERICMHDSVDGSQPCQAILQERTHLAAPISAHISSKRPLSPWTSKRIRRVPPETLPL